MKLSEVRVGDIVEVSPEHQRKMFKNIGRNRWAGVRMRVEGFVAYGMQPYPNDKMVACRPIERQPSGVRQTIKWFARSLDLLSRGAGNGVVAAAAVFSRRTQIVM